MADWKKTLEPYIKVQEIVKTVPQNPTAGEDLIVGVAIMSDAGPCTPTLINGQKEFREVFASEEITQDYVKSLDNLYIGDGDKSLASTMWSNAYRLAGSTTLLVVRAGSGSNLFFTKPMSTKDENTYILRDGELLKRISNGFRLAINKDLDYYTVDDDGWSININEVGIFGNRTTDNGLQCDYLVTNLPDLVDYLNGTSKFFAPGKIDYRDKNDNKLNISAYSSLDDKLKVSKVVFDEVYLAANFLDKTDSRTEYYFDNKVTGASESANIGFVNLTVAQADASYANLRQVGSTSNEYKDAPLDMNSEAYSGFEPAKYYATNIYNSATDLKVRIRRFNHDAVVEKSIGDQATLTENGQSPYTVLTGALDTFTEKGTKEPDENVLARDFFEVAVLDPKASDVVSFFNVGNITGRGDMTVEEVNESLSMINLVLPDDLHDLGLDYYGYAEDDFAVEPYDGIPVGWSECESRIAALDETTAEGAAQIIEEKKNLAKIATTVTKKSELSNYFKEKYVAKIYYVSQLNAFFTIVKKNKLQQIFSDLTVNPLKTQIISVSDTHLQQAIDLITEDEIYVTEGLCDLGNTNLGFQSYMSNIAINENFFYPISTINSTNYLTIANNAKKLSQDSYKLYLSAPWDIDSSTLGWKFFACPSVLYWETVAKNRRNNEEFRPCFGQVSIAYQSPVTEFNKKTRELLLSKKVNTVKWDTQTQAWNMNDNYTKQTENTIMNDESNSRLAVRISKNVPVLLRQFIGKKISERLCKDIYDTVDYWFRADILPMTYTVEAYKIHCVYDAALARKNKVRVKIAVRFSRALKFIDVIDYYFDTGVELSVEE